MTTIYYAHTLEGRPSENWEALEDHLAEVAERAAEFTQVFGARDWGRLAGLWHDLGKYSQEFQDRLHSAQGPDAHLEGLVRVDHSTAGAQHAAQRFPGTAGLLLAYCIAGHHAGLPDNYDPQGGQSSLQQRLVKKTCDWSAAPTALLDQPPPDTPPLEWSRNHKLCAFQAAVFCHMLFSSLIDADRLATEAFVRPQQAAERPLQQMTPRALLPHLDAYLDRLQRRSSDTPVNRARTSVLAQCRAKAKLPTGLFSLTVPTGGGKTLSSLAFALRHAACHNCRRVIYAIPFTSIIEQNVDVFREALSTSGYEVVLEHHSNLDPGTESRWSTLAAENWDAPVVVTTNVQLFESLFASHTSRCRKLHRIAGSVIILDECQTLPVDLLEPTLRMLEELCRNYGCTVVLCSATQPAVQHRPGFDIGLRDVRELIEDPPALYTSLRRVEAQHVGHLADEALVGLLSTHEQVLCIVNTRGHAARLFGLLRDIAGSEVFHLSAQMCAAHRTITLNSIRQRLQQPSAGPCRVISTQLIEAGVDIDFPVVYRAMTGLDSLAQAAGRCNREGRLHRGHLYVFDTDVDPPGDLRWRRQMGSEAAQDPDFLSLEAIEEFFRLCYWTRNQEWDKHGILECFALTSNTAQFQFREAASKYRLIPDTQHSVIVPYDTEGRARIARLMRMPEPPGPAFGRSIQRYVVGVYERQFDQLRDSQAIAQYHERFFVLQNNSAYDNDLGLMLDKAGFDPASLYVGFDRGP